MASNFQNPTITGVATQTAAATQANHLVRLGELLALLAATGGGHSGTATVAQNDTGGQVTGLALGFTPTKVYLTVQIPSGGLGLLAAAVGVPTTDGFTWVFTNGVPDNGNYKLHYLLLP